MSKAAPKPDWVKNFEAALADYYEEPVRPVSEYCEALQTWSRVVVKNHEPNEGDSRFDPMVELAQALRNETPIRKSNLLFRLIYLGEPLRTEPCPIHKGHWSGCAFGSGACQNEPSCMSGYDITGWLPPGEDG